MTPTIIAPIVDTAPVAPVPDTFRFLQRIFGEKSEKLCIYIWTWPDRKAAYFRDLEEAAKYAESRKKDSDVYVGCAMTPEPWEANQRIKIVEGRKPAGICALWADIDIQDPGHKKEGLPPDLNAAKSILLDNLPPSLIVHTGGGIHCWWILKEPWEFSDDADMQRAAVLATRWNRMLKARAAAKGWALDSVGDLSRVLRVAGTHNLKIPGNIRDVVVTEQNDARYNASDLEEYLDLMGAQQITFTEIINEDQGKLSYSVNAEPPLDKLMALLENDRTFKQTYERKRKDFKDQSASSYDMALANYGVQAGWSDQEIVNLIIHWRRKYNEKLADKMRDSYMLATIRKARAAFKHLEYLDELPSAPVAADISMLAQVPNAAALPALPRRRRFAL
jgi:hypothetical protein